MKEPISIVRNQFDSEIREVNSLEKSILSSEETADAALWSQAELVIQLLKSMKQRDLAHQWINARTGKHYVQSHVSYIVQVFDQHADQVPRPIFRNAYNKIAHKRKLSIGEEVDKQPGQRWARLIADMGTLANSIKKHGIKKLSRRWPKDRKVYFARKLRRTAKLFESFAKEIE